MVAAARDRQQEADSVVDCQQWVAARSRRRRRRTQLERVHGAQPTDSFETLKQRLINCTRHMACLHQHPPLCCHPCAHLEHYAGLGVRLVLLLARLDPCQAPSNSLLAFACLAKAAHHQMTAASLATFTSLHSLSASCLEAVEEQ